MSPNHPRRTACDQCRTHRAKCEIDGPVCERCKSLGNRCTFPFKKTPQDKPQSASTKDTRRNSDWPRFITVDPGAKSKSQQRRQQQQQQQEADSRGLYSPGPDDRSKDANGKRVSHNTPSNRREDWSAETSFDPLPSPFTAAATPSTSWETLFTAGDNCWPTGSEEMISPQAADWVLGGVGPSQTNSDTRICTFDELVSTQSDNTSAPSNSYGGLQPLLNDQGTPSKQSASNPTDLLRSESDTGQQTAVATQTLCTSLFKLQRWGGVSHSLGRGHENFHNPPVDKFLALHDEITEIWSKLPLWHSGACLPHNCAEMMLVNIEQLASLTINQKKCLKHKTSASERVWIGEYRLQTVAERHDVLAKVFETRRQTLLRYVRMLRSRIAPGDTSDIEERVVQLENALLLSASGQGDTEMWHPE